MNRKIATNKPKKWTQCLRCGGDVWMPSTTSSHVCRKCGFEQAIELPDWGEMPLGSLDHLECDGKGRFNPEDQL